MKLTRHAEQRLNQRGISRMMVEIARKIGNWKGDKLLVDRKALKQELKKLDTQRQVLQKMLNKGGLVLVECPDTLITAYNHL